MKNVVAYCRVSTDAQAGEDRFGIETQKEQIMDYCAKNDMQISAWYIDEGKSGAKEDRPEFDKIIYGTEINNPPIEAVVVAKNDRIARDINIYFYYKHELLKKNMKLVSVSEDFGVMGAFKSALEALVLCMAEQERENITKRTSGGRKVKAAKGGYSGGRTPYGYRAKDRKMEIVESEAETVKQIFSLKDSGATFQQVVDTLNSQGKTNKSGGKFSISTIQVILENRKVYEGFYKYGKTDEWVQGQHEAILHP